jgi:hypothetical protein
VARQHDGTIIAALSQTKGFCQDGELTALESDRAMLFAHLMILSLITLVSGVFTMIF